MRLARYHFRPFLILVILVAGFSLTMFASQQGNTSAQVPEPEEEITSLELIFDVIVDGQKISLKRAHLLDILIDIDDSIKLFLSDENGQILSELPLTDGKRIPADLIINIGKTTAMLIPATLNNPESEAIVELLKKGYFSLSATGTFEGNVVINRAETLRLMALSLGISFDSASPSWIRTLQQVFAERKIITGQIHPDSFENRANFLAIIAKSKGVDLSLLPVCKKVPFSDVAVKVWYCPVVQHAVSEGWLSSGAALFNPSSLVDRSTAAGWIYRAFLTPSIESYFPQFFRQIIGWNL